MKNASNFARHTELPKTIRPVCKHLIFNFQHVIIQPKHFRKACASLKRNACRNITLIDLDNSLVIRTNYQLVSRRQHALTQNSTQRSRIQHERLSVIKTCWYGAFWRQPNCPHISMNIRRTANHLHVTIIITWNVRYATIVNFSHAQTIRIRMLFTLNNPHNVCATIFGFQVNHFLDTAKLLIYPRHQLINWRQLKINQLFYKI